jgi:hypothetical protein
MSTFFGDYPTTLVTAYIANFSSYEDIILQNDQGLLSLFGLSTTGVGFPQDHFLGIGAIDVDPSLGITITGIDFRREIVNNSGSPAYLLDNYFLDLSSNPISGDHPGYSVTEYRGFNLDNNTNDKSQVGIEIFIEGGDPPTVPISEGATRYNFRCGFIVGYEDWLTNPNLPPSFLTQNKKWYDADGDILHQIRFVTVIHAENSLGSGTYKNIFVSQPLMGTADYNSNSLLSITETFTRVSDDTVVPATIYRGGPVVRYDCVFEVIDPFKKFYVSDLFEVGDDVRSIVYAELQVDEVDGDGAGTAFQFSTKHETITGSPMQPLDGETFMTAVLTATNQITISCLIDATDLPYDSCRFAPQIKTAIIDADEFP